VNLLSWNVDYLDCNYSLIYVIEIVWVRKNHTLGAGLETQTWVTPYINRTGRCYYLKPLSIPERMLLPLMVGIRHLSVYHVIHFF
jgi:hypothetical protein